MSPQYAGPIDEDSPIEYPDFKPRVYNLLRRAGYTNAPLKQLLAHSEEALRPPNSVVRGFTDEDVDHIIEVLDKHDLFLFARIPDDTPIEILGLKSMGRNALIKAGITTVGDLDDYPELKLLAIPEFGHRSLKHVIREMKRYGRTIKRYQRWW